MTIGHKLKNIYKHVRMFFWGLRVSQLRGRFIGPKIVINGIPKSGNNLLLEVMINIPLIRGVNKRTINIDDGLQFAIASIKHMGKGQCISGHLAFDSVLHAEMLKNDVYHIIIIRDLRDVIISNINYLDNIHISHPHNLFFKKLSTIDEKIRFCLHGIPDKNINSLVKISKDYRTWKSAENTLVIKFENLINHDGKVAENEIGKIIIFLNIQEKLSISDISGNMININSLTFNNPSLNKWKNYFTKDQLDYINHYLKEELEYWGYL